MSIWTRIATEGEDFYDVRESYEEVKRLINDGNRFIEVYSITNYKVTIRISAIQAFYESGEEILRANWERIKEMEQLKKSITGWEE